MLLDENEDEKRQTMCFLNVIGPRGRAVYDTLELTAVTDKLKIRPVMDKFEAHCVSRQNEVLGCKRK